VNSNEFIFEVDVLNDIYDNYLDFYKPYSKGIHTGKAFKDMRQQMRDDINSIASNVMINTLNIYEHYFNIIVKHLNNDYSQIKKMKQAVTEYKQTIYPDYIRVIATDFELVQYFVEQEQFNEGGIFYRYTQEDI
jgi:hypothetical protein